MSDHPTARSAELLATLELRHGRGESDRSVWDLVRKAGSAVAALAEAPRPGRARRRKSKPAAARILPGDLIERAEEADLGALMVGGDGYPPRVLDLGDPPSVLWTRGDCSVLDMPSVAVVGSRRATESGRRVAREIGYGLAEAGLVVVSGLALGVDASAHEGALAGGGLTIAVLGSGADRPSPAANRRLYDRIVRSGLVLSEFDPGATAAPYHFPRRNRVIAALPHAVVVVEAAERSGALITVDHALDLGRGVFAVPGPLDRMQSAGTNALIRDGAGLVTSVDALVDELHEELIGKRARLGPGQLALFPTERRAHQTAVRSDAAARARGETRRQLSAGARPTPAVDEGLQSIEVSLRSALAEGPSSLDELARRSGLAMSALGAAILEMELRGTVRAEGAQYRWIRN